MNPYQQPLIGITPESVTLSRTDGCGAFCGNSYTAAVEQAGGIPLILPLTRDPVTLEPFLSLCNGFILSGGGDFDEASTAYGRTLTDVEQKSISGMDTVRDEMEVWLARRIVEKDAPVLGICRGLQTLNVALGGTLVPDVPGHRHRDPFALAHNIVWEGTGRLVGLMAQDCRQVNSTHHQAIDRVAPALRVAGRADDNVIEAAEKPGARFCVGVQFHPERLTDKVTACRRLFAALIEVASTVR